MEIQEQPVLQDQQEQLAQPVLQVLRVQPGRRDLPGRLALLVQLV